MIVVTLIVVERGGSVVRYEGVSLWKVGDRGLLRFEQGEEGGGLAWRVVVIPPQAYTRFEVES